MTSLRLSDWMSEDVVNTVNPYINMRMGIKHLVYIQPHDNTKYVIHSSSTYQDSNKNRYQTPNKHRYQIPGQYDNHMTTQSM